MVAPTTNIKTISYSVKCPIIHFCKLGPKLIQNPWTIPYSLISSKPNNLLLENAQININTKRLSQMIIQIKLKNMYNLI